VLVGFAGLVGCGGKAPREEKTAEAMAEQALEAATGKKTDVSLEKGNVVIENQDMKAELEQTAQWPADMFAEVPEFTFGKVQRVSKTTADARRTFNVYLGEVEADAVDRYEVLLKERGWTTDVTRMGAQAALMNGQKDKLGLNFVYNGNDNTAVLAAFTAPE